MRLALHSVSYAGVWPGQTRLPVRPILYVTELARLAHDLGSNVVRIFTGFAKPGVAYETMWGWCVDALRECAQRAADYGVTVGVQNHHDVAVHYESLRDLIRDVGHPN